jgi:hypothetical protein
MLIDKQWLKSSRVFYLLNEKKTNQLSCARHIYTHTHTQIVNDADNSDPSTVFYIIYHHERTVIEYSTRQNEKFQEIKIERRMPPLLTYEVN